MSLRTALEWLGIRKTALEEARAGTALVGIKGAVGQVRVRGTIVPPETPLFAMLSGSPCVHWAATYLERDTVNVQGGRGGETEQVIWRQHFRTGRSTSFDIADAAEAKARVEVDVDWMEAGARDPMSYEAADSLIGVHRNAEWKERHGNLELSAGTIGWLAPMRQVTENQRLNSMPADLEAFLRAHGVAPTQFMGLLQEHKFFEAALVPGMPVEVIGDASQGLDPGGVAYRGGEGITVLRPRFISFVGQ
jgi:hypothetical protein